MRKPAGRTDKKVTEGATAFQIIEYLQGRPLLQKVGVKKTSAAPKAAPKPSLSVPKPH